MPYFGKRVQCSFDIDGMKAVWRTYCAFGQSPEGEEHTLTLPCKGQGLCMRGQVNACFAQSVS
jgi:hypothetical protein